MEEKNVVPVYFDDYDDDDFDEILSFERTSELTEIKEDLKKILARLDEILER